MGRFTLWPQFEPAEHPIDHLLRSGSNPVGGENDRGSSESYVLARSYTIHETPELMHRM